MGRKLIIFAASAAVVYLMTILLWPVVSGAFTSAFAATGNIVFASFGPSGRVDFTPLEEPEAFNDTRLRMTNHRAGMRRASTISARHLAYVPMAVAASVLLTLPVAWKRRWRVLTLGLLATSLFVVFRLWLKLFFEFGEPPIAMYQRGDALQGALEHLSQLTYRSTSASISAPLIISLLVVVLTLRDTEWRRIQGKAELD